MPIVEPPVRLRRCFLGKISIKDSEIRKFHYIKILQDPFCYA